MGCVQRAVLEFDEEVRAPWRPRLVDGAGHDGNLVGASRDGGDHGSGVLRLGTPSRRSPSRVEACRSSERPVHTGSASEVSRFSPPPGPGRPAAGRLRPTRRARRLAVVLALAVGVALGSWVGPLLTGGGDLRLAGDSSVVVRPGDTLWSIAGELAGDGDVRGVVDRIQELNGLSDAEILPGQTLRLP